MSYAQGLNLIVPCICSSHKQLTICWLTAISSVLQSIGSMGDIAASDKSSIKRDDSCTEGHKDHMSPRKTKNISHFILQLRAPAPHLQNS
jgi:hypothetical protein